MNARRAVLRVRFSRRSLLAGGVAAPAVLAACGLAGRGGDQPTAAPVAIRHTPWPPVVDLQSAQAVEKLFAQRHPSIAVQIEPGQGNQYDKLESLMAAGSESDTFHLQGWFWQGYAVRGALLDLNPVLRKDRAFPASAVFAKPQLEQTRWQDRTYMVPSDTGGYVLFYNKDLFDRAGVAYPNERWTWDDWFRAAERLTGGQAETKTFGYEVSDQWWRNAPWWKQAGKEAFDRVVGPTRCLLDDPNVLDAVQRQADMRLRYRYAPMPEDRAPIYDGRTAMKPEGDWTMKFYKPPKFAWDIAPLPRHKQPATILLVHGHAASARTRHPEAVWQWLKFWTTEEGQRQHVITTGRVPITPELAKKLFLTYAKAEFGVPSPEVFLRRWEHGSHWGISDVNADLETQVLNPLFRAALRGEQPVVSAMREATRQANEILKRSRMAEAR